MRAMYRALAVLIFSLPLCGGVLTTYSIEWSLTEKATGTVTCSGTSSESMNVLGLCGAFDIFAQADSGFLSADAIAQGGINGVDLDLFDARLFIQASTVSTTTVMALGGTGAALIELGGNATGGASDPAGFFDALALFGAFGCVDCQVEIPITFGESVIVLTSATAGLERTGLGGTTASAFAILVPGRLLDLNRDVVPGANLQEVPEPSTFFLAMLLLPMAAIARWRS